MWRDPLEELIEDLERADPQSASGDLIPLEQIQQYIDVVLYGTDDEANWLEADPGYQAWLRQLAKACGRGNAT